jgi:tellurite resistance protein
MMSRLLRVPPSFFSIPFGIAGLGLVWLLMTSLYGSPAVISDVLFILAAAVWLVLAFGVLARLTRAPAIVIGELRDPVLSPFWGVVFIVGMQLAIGLAPHAYGVARVVFIVFLVATVGFGGWITGEWITSPLDLSRFHPGYVLPTVAGGFIAAQGAAEFGLRAVGWMTFGAGIVCWLMIGSLTLNRLLFMRMLPAALIPLLAIELAPPAVGGNAYFALDRGVPSTLAYGLAGYTGLMIVVQLRLLPVYRRLSFSNSFWAFTFTWTAVAAFALRWLHIERPGGETVYAGLVAGAASLLIAAVAARSLVAIARGQFLPVPSAPEGTPALLTAAQPGRAR